MILDRVNKNPRNKVSTPRATKRFSMKLLPLGKLIDPLEERGNSVRAVHPADAVRGFLRVDSDGGHEER